MVCPLVEESEALQAKAATAEFERLRTTEFREQRVELIHGQLPSKAKQAAMEAFASGEADVLVATSVVEVGIDVPNATVMLIEAAERYGLSQLHQLRGRVGRGGHSSLCILFGDAKLPRLDAIANEDDGFRLAEVDLEIRGAGDVLGTRQHGLPELRVARLPEDTELLVRARDRADELLRADPELSEPEHALLRDAVARALRLGARPDPGMRVVAGEFGGRRLQAPRGRATRPTSDRVREALFAILGDVRGARVLDLFAGSGALGHRGAVAWRRVGRLRRARPRRGGRDHGATSTRSGSLGAEVRAAGRAAVPGRPARAPSTSCSSTRRMIPLPACAGPLSAALPAVLTEDALIVTESSKRTPLELSLPLLRERTYGDTRIAIHG